MILTPAQAKKFYNRFGIKQDSQSFYEDAALDELVARADFEHAAKVFEFGCGTGRFAKRLLSKHLSESATYFGIDISDTMIGIASERLCDFGERVRVALSQGEITFPLEDASVDRVVSTYVLDLLSEQHVHQAINEAQRVLVKNGKLCLASLGQGSNVISHLVTNVWSAIFRLNASLVGGCRPIRLTPYFDPQHWSIDFQTVKVQFGVPSEVLVASRK